jgi:hypothetical protein
MTSMQASADGPSVNGLIPAAWVASTTNLRVPPASEAARRP